AKVQLVTDRAAGVAVLLEAARRQGILRGAGPGRLEVDYVPRQADVAVGDRVVTAGVDGVYPRGLPVGTVSAVEAGNEMFHRVEVTPAVDFADLSLVFLLEGAAPPAALTRGESDALR
ncbi:MAG: rod shape-determining protein MreC, partial [Thermoanaerobaculia bacterium]